MRKIGLGFGGRAGGTSAVRVVAAGVLLAAWTACGGDDANQSGVGAGGTGGSGSDGAPPGADARNDTAADTSTLTDATMSFDAGADAAPDIASDASTPSDAAIDAPTDTTGVIDAAPTTTLRVHYPAGAHTMTIRGSAPALSWTQGQPTNGSGDTFTYDLTNLAAPAEWKPLLDDATYARGPNYHVAPGETVDVWPHFTTVKGEVVTLVASFHSTVLGNDRAIYAYLPPSYAENTDATFPVVYMHDGQNLWAALPQLAFGTTWNVDTAFDAAAENGACSAGGVVGWGAEPLDGAPPTCTGDGDCASGECRTFPEAIVIGVANDSDRIYEYTPTTDPGTAGGGGADLYLEMLVDELKPAVDGMLRTRPEVASTAMAGSSLGGLLTAYAGTTRADVFGRLAALSPSTYWNNDVIVTDVAATAASPRPLVVYVDSGEGSGDDQADTDTLASAYLMLGYVDGTTFRHVVQAGAAHNETYWAERFPGAMQFALGPR